MQSLNQALLKFQNLNLEITKNSKAQITDRAYYSYADLPHVLEMVNNERKRHHGVVHKGCTCRVR
jgi:hypothetical protein